MSIVFRLSLFVGCAACAATLAWVNQPTVTSLARGLVKPESVAVGMSIPKLFPVYTVVVSEIGEFNKDGDGKITKINGAEKTTLAEGLDDPKGLVFVGDQLFVTDKTRIWRIGPKGGKEVFVAAEAFPAVPKFLNDIEADAAGTLYVSDSGKDGAGGAVYAVSTDGKVTTLLDASHEKVKAPNGLLVDGPDHLLVLDFKTGELNRVSLKDKSFEKIADGLEGGDGIARDFDGNLYVTQWSTGVLSILRGGKGPAVPYGPKFKNSADLALNPKSGQLLIPDMSEGTLTAVAIAGATPDDVDASPVTGVKIKPAFPNVEEITRPIVITHAGDGSGRLFIASQLGNVYVLDKADDAAEAKLWFPFQPHVTYKDTENEEGVLSLPFHQKFKENREFFVFYTKKDAPPHTSVVSRFKASADCAAADPATEEELLRVPQPFWNHNGGTIAFGPDGKLYVGLGDGGLFNDPEGNGQNLATLNGSILRIDVDAKDPGLGYAVPKDNPFVGQAGARGEIWAYGIRNIWRLAFDRKTGDLWAADVGQDIWEEVNLVTRGANLGWNKREGMHRFRATGSAADPQFTEPVWEYHHDVGKSVTGGSVYRGAKVPALAGAYVYGDYVSGKLWALSYDAAAKRVTANRPIEGNVLPIVSFGEDEAGELYFTTTGNRFFSFTAE